MIGSLIDTWNASVQKLQPGHCCQIHNWFQTRIYSYQSILEQSRITLLLSWHLDIKRRSGKKNPKIALGEMQQVFFIMFSLIENQQQKMKYIS